MAGRRDCRPAILWFDTSRKRRFCSSSSTENIPSGDEWALFPLAQSRETVVARSCDHRGVPRMYRSLFLDKELRSDEGLRRHSERKVVDEQRNPERRPSSAV